VEFQTSSGFDIRSSLAEIERHLLTIRSARQHVLRTGGAPDRLGVCGVAEGVGAGGVDEVDPVVG